MSAGQHNFNLNPPPRWTWEFECPNANLMNVDRRAGLRYLPPPYRPARVHYARVGGRAQAVHVKHSLDISTNRFRSSLAMLRPTSAARVSSPNGSGANTEISNSGAVHRQGNSAPFPLLMRQSYRAIKTYPGSVLGYPGSELRYPGAVLVHPSPSVPGAPPAQILDLSTCSKEEANGFQSRMSSLVRYLFCPLFVTSCRSVGAEIAQRYCTQLFKCNPHKQV